MPLLQPCSSVTLASPLRHLAAAVLEVRLKLQLHSEVLQFQRLEAVLQPQLLLVSLKPTRQLDLVSPMAALVREVAVLGSHPRHRSNNNLEDSALASQVALQASVVAFQWALQDLLNLVLAVAALSGLSDLGVPDKLRQA